MALFILYFACECDESTTEVAVEITQ